ncbi:hypothetical protein [Butyrivibrio sp. WCD2001]|uniref:hypothetical protein n=1 Tax=Butyrivibrio sp. WCD2001 TaxID=1280681 RepID=UPI00040B8C39|nr:hypothetical protein [Butyrivibrio sp. WCD2001]
MKKNSFGKNSFSGTKKGLLVRKPKLKTAKKYICYNTMPSCEKERTEWVQDKNIKK